MSIIAEFTIPLDDSPIGVALQEANATIEFDRVVPTNDGVLPYVWVDSDDPEAFVRTLDEQPAVAAVAAVTATDGASLVHIRWSNCLDSLGSCLQTADATLLELTGSVHLYLRVRFPGHPAVAEFYTVCVRSNLSIRLEGLTELTERPPIARSYDLTADQREALELALERGYFESPSRVTLGELATDLGISQQALSQRVRTATRKVLEKAIVESQASPSALK